MTPVEIADAYRKATADGPGSLSESEWSRLPPGDQVLLAGFWDREIRQLATWVAEIERLAARSRRPGGVG